MSSKNYIEKVAIVGAGGNVGKYITEALLKAGKHQVTAITRTDSKSQIPSGVNVKHIDYNNHASIVEALKGQDVLIITMVAHAQKEQQLKLIEAAAEAKVEWILPNEYGNDNSDPAVVKDLPFIYGHKDVVRDQIEKLGCNWICVATNFWYEWSVGLGPWCYGFDIKNRTAIFYEDGKLRFNTTTWPQVGRAVANLLSLKINPENENDKSPTLSQFKNNWVHVSSFNTTQEEILASLIRVTGTTDKDWTITKVPVKDYFQTSLAKIQEDRTNFAKALYSRYFFPDIKGNFLLPKGKDNDTLNLPQEDFDQATKDAITFSENFKFFF